CNLKVAPSNIHHFVRQRELRMASKPETVRKVDAGDRQSAASASRSRSVDRTSGSIKEQDDEVRARIDALKRRQESKSPTRKAFEFNPAEPLRLKKQRSVPTGQTPTAVTAKRTAPCGETR